MAARYSFGTKIFLLCVPKNVARENFRFGSRRKKFSRHSEKKVARVFRKVFALSAGIRRISAGTASALFLIYSVLNGLLCSGVLLIYAQESVYTAFFSTAGMFAVMSVYGLYTRRDLTSLGSFLYMGNCLIRFFPSFCFSRSFFFRDISPP